MSTRSRRGFTLVEAIVLIALVGILATIAAPNFLRMQVRSRTAEAVTNLGRLRDAELAAYAELGEFVRAGSAPEGVPGKHARPWAGGNSLEFREFLGFEPEGAVFFQYGANGAGDAFTLTAISDLDGRGPRAQFGLVHPAPGEDLGLGHEIGSCSRHGVWDATTHSATLRDAIGPCGAQDGRTTL